MSDPTEEIVKREIAAARAILREDKVLAKLNRHFPDKPDDEGGDGSPKPPPEHEETEKPVKKGVWWP